MAGTDASIRQFFRDLAAVQDDIVKVKSMRFQMDMALDIQRRAKENIKTIFAGKGGSPRSALTMMAYGNSARTSGAGGGLMNSVVIERGAGGGLAVSVGGPGVPYAAIHEFGGTIVPKNASFLTIPVNPAAVGHRAREFDLEFLVDDKWGRSLWNRQTGEVYYLLRSQVTIPKRPYLQPAVDDATKDPAVRAMMTRYFGGDRFGVKVK